MRHGLSGDLLRVKVESPVGGVGSQPNVQSFRFDCHWICSTVVRMMDDIVIYRAYASMHERMYEAGWYMKISWTKAGT